MADTLGHGPRIAVYSCYFGLHEPFNPLATGPEGPWERVVFTDRKKLPVDGVRIETVSRPDLSSAILSRLPKLCPHRWFSDLDWVIYIDNRANLKRPANEIVAEIEARYPNGAPPGRYLFPHRKRVCAWREVRACRNKGFIAKDVAKRVFSIFEHSAFPTDFGLFVNTCMIQKMGSAATNRLNDVWFAQLADVVHRDQILLPYLLWLSGTPYEVLEHDPQDLFDWPVIKAWQRERFRLRHAAPDGAAAAAVDAAESSPPEEVAKS